MILRVRNIIKEFEVEGGFFYKAGTVTALDRISFSMNFLDTLGIVGESGSGKTTLAKIILKLIFPTSGEVVFDNTLINNFRKDVQIIFQNPYNSLNPKMRIIDAISEPLRIHKIVPPGEVKGKVIQLLNMVGLTEASLYRYPRAFSGGERQRICIARALSTEPKFLVLDEPVSSLDLTIQSRLLDLFREIKEKMKLTYIFVSHNLAVVKQMSNSVIVMKDGKIVEAGSPEEIFKDPRHPYTRLLLEASRG